MLKIKVLDKEITLIKLKGEDYVSPAKMFKAKYGEIFISDWLRNRSRKTIKYLGISKKVHELDFNYGEYVTITLNIDLKFKQYYNTRNRKQM